MQKLKSNAVEGTVGKGLVQMPEISENTHLKDLITEKAFGMTNNVYTLSSAPKKF